MPEVDDVPHDLPEVYQSAKDGTSFKRRASVSAEVITEEQSLSFRAKRYPKTPDELAQLTAATKNNFLFQDMPPDQLRRVFESMFETKAAQGEEVVVQGQEGDNFYIIAAGTFEAIKDGEVVFTYNGTGSFGELALMYNTPRAATVVARTSGVLWALDRATFTHMLVGDRRRRALCSQEWLSKIPILDYLSPDELAKLADMLISRKYAAGETVFAQGEGGETFFLVEEGEAQGVHTSGESGEKRNVARFVQGDYFGERALITDEPRALTVVAETALQVLCLDAPAFERILGPCKHAMRERIAKYESLVNAENSHGDDESAV